MNNLINLLIGIAVLILGFPIGNYLAKYTKDEAKTGQKWFKLLIILSLVVVTIGLVIGNDVLLFTFSFIAIVTSRSLIKKK